MKIAIVTGRLPHHIHFCREIALRHKVVGIIHPSSQRSTKGRWQRLRALRSSHGFVHATLRASSKLPAVITGWNRAAENQRAEALYFGDSQRWLEESDRGIVFDHVKVNTDDGPALIRSLGADVVINLGGIVYERTFIDSCGTMFNYHSGLSPIYNGSQTVYFAYANGHPHLCGGTLMTMSSEIDGGDVLAHYLPSVEGGDTPATLSMKTFAGAAVLYHRFLSALEKGQPFRGVPQGGSLFYLRGSDWTLCQSVRTAHFIRNNLASRYVRPEKIVEYWREGDDASAARLHRNVLSRLLWRDRSCSAPI